MEVAARPLPLAVQVVVVVHLLPSAVQVAAERPHQAAAVAELRLPVAAEGPCPEPVVVAARTFPVVAVERPHQAGVAVLHRQEEAAEAEAASCWWYRSLLAAQALPENGRGLRVRGRARLVWPGSMPCVVLVPRN